MWPETLKKLTMDIKRKHQDFSKNNMFKGKKRRGIMKRSNAQQHM